jgi:probable HAF family extracellular repeat protein
MQMMTPIEVETTSRRVAWRLWSGAALLILAGAAHAQYYAVTDLGAVGGTNSMAYGINNHEQIVGAARTGMGTYHAFMFDSGRMMDLGTLGGSNSMAYGINDRGWMVGAAGVNGTNMHAFLCTNALMNSGMMDLGSMGGSNSAALMINMHGDMTGWAAMTNGSHHAFFMTNGMFGGMMDLGTAGGTNAEAYCLNSNRMIVGYTMMGDGSERPIMDTNVMMGSSSMMTMGMGSMGASGGQALSVNDLGNTAGQAQMPGGNSHAFMTSSGGMMGGTTLDLGTLGGNNSVAYGMNNAGMAVGMAETSDGMPHAFIATSSGMGGSVRMSDLNDLVPTNSGWMLMEARSINASGQIVGFGMYGGRTNAFLLTPVSAPVMTMSAPASQVAGPGGSVTLRIQMSASEPLTYQWLRNGTPMAGATNQTLNLAGMTMAGAGQYTVMVRNSVGTVAMSSTTVAMFSMNRTNGGPRLTVAAPVGSHFRIDYSDRLGTSANWQTMTNLTMSVSSTQIVATPASGPGTRFYRAVMVP